MRQTRRFPNRAESVTIARHFVVDALDTTPRTVVSAVELLVSELVTNVVRHTDAGFTLSLCQTPAQIRVEVTDTGSGEPAMRSPKPTEPTGRGLRLVQAMSNAWGVTRGVGQPGKTVWFTIPTQDETPAGGGRRAASGRFRAPGVRTRTGLRPAEGGRAGRRGPWLGCVVAARCATAMGTPWLAPAERGACG